MDFGSVDRLLTELVELLGTDAVTSCRTGDTDARTAQHVSGLNIGTPLCWVRPASTDQCARVARICAHYGCPMVPVGDATAFWDNLRVGDAVVVDTRALGNTVEIDVERRLAIAAAGASVADVDRAARAHGLSLVAYPDSSGDTLIATLLAVGCTAGLGLGRRMPVEQFTGATIVTGNGRVVRVGAGSTRVGAPFTQHGRANLLSLIAAAQGKGALITEVALSLDKSHPIADLTLSGTPDCVRNRRMMLRVLRAARGAIDDQVLDGMRIELNSESDGGSRFEVMIRTFSPDGPNLAARAAEDIARRIANPSLKVRTLRIEGKADRRGEGEGYFARFPVPPGQHRARLEGAAFWGLEVGTSWGEWELVLDLLLALFDECVVASPLHRRLGIYPGRQGVSLGLQLTVPRGGGSIAAAREVLRAALPRFLEAGVVPYRDGHLWREAVAEHRGGIAPEEAQHDIVQRCLTLLDPMGILGTPGLVTKTGPSGSSDFAAQCRQSIARVLRDNPEWGIASLGDTGLHLPIGESAVDVQLSAESNNEAIAISKGVFATYSLRGSMSDTERDLAKQRIEELFSALRTAREALEQRVLAAEDFTKSIEQAEQVTRLELADELTKDPASLRVPVSEAYAKLVEEGRRPPAVETLPPCLQLEQRPTLPADPVRVQLPLSTPCLDCGAAAFCVANSLPNEKPRVELRPLRHSNATTASWACARAIQKIAMNNGDGAYNSGASDLLHTLLAARRGVLSLPPLPLEFSIKTEGGVLVPSLRVVEYSPEYPADARLRAAHTQARRQRSVELLSQTGFGGLTNTYKDWLTLLERTEGSNVEITQGWELGHDEESNRFQAYAHLSPEPREKMERTVEHCLAWTKAPNKIQKALLKFIKQSGAAVHLIGWSPDGSGFKTTLKGLPRSEENGDGPPSAIPEQSTRRLKLYIGLPSDTEDRATELSPPDLGDLASFAGRNGLAVYDVTSGGGSWLKWDFPIKRHYQVASRLTTAFAQGLHPDERDKLLSLLSGEAFSVWPTWLSVSPGSPQRPETRTLYFVPR